MLGWKKQIIIVQKRQEKVKKKKMELGGSSAQEQGHRYANFFYPNPKKVLSEIAVFIK